MVNIKVTTEAIKLCSNSKPNDKRKNKAPKNQRKIFRISKKVFMVISFSYSFLKPGEADF